MAKKLHRYSFNGGEISPDLWTRGDLQRNANGCRYMRNASVEITGSSKRIPGSGLVARLDLDGADPAAARVASFDVDADTHYWVCLFPNGAGTTCRIFANSGSVLATLSVPYAPADLPTVQCLQSYDVMYLVHPDHWTREIIRTSDTEWSIQKFAFNAGPIGFVNTDRTKSVAFEINQYAAGTTYATGDYVTAGGSDTLVGDAHRYFAETATYYSNLDGANYNWYYTRIQPAAGTAAYRRGDTITIAGGNMAGTWRVQKVDGTYLYLNTWTYSVSLGDYVNDFDGVDVDGDTFYLASGRGEQIYVSLVDSNTGHTPASSPTYWALVDYFGNDQTLISAADTFEASMVGKLFRIDDPTGRRAYGKWTSSEEDAVSTALPAYGVVTLTTEGGVWKGEIVLELSYDQGLTWEIVGSITSYNGERNGTITRSVEEIDVLCRARMKERSAATGDTGCIYHLDVVGTQYVYCYVTAVTDARTATVQVTSHVPRYFSTWRWALGAIDGADGFPGCMTIFEERVVLSGIPGHPGVVFGSTVDDWHNWQDGTLQTSPFRFTLSGGARNNVYWLEPKDALIIGADGAEFSIGAREQAEILSGGNVSAKKRGDFGSAQLPGVSAGDRVYYVEAGNRNLRAMYYEWQKEGWSSDEVMDFSRHLVAEYGIVDMAFQRAPQSILWCLREDGVLMTYTFNDRHQVAGWAQHDVGGTVLALDTARINGGSEVGMIVERSGDLYLEVLNPTFPCLNHYVKMTNAGADLLYLPTSEDLSAWSASFAGISPAIGQGYLVYIGYTPVVGLVLYRNHQALQEGVDYHVTDSGLIWIPDGYGGITADDEDGPIASGWVNVRTITKAVVYTVYDDAVDLSTCVCKELASTIIYKYPQEDHRQIVAFPPTPPTDVADYTLHVAGTPLTLGTQYSVAIPTATEQFVFAAHLSAGIATVHLGQQAEMLLAPTDLIGGADLGGPGGHARISGCEIYLIDSMGGEISVDEGATWVPISYPTHADPDSPAPGFTGMVHVPVAGAWSEDGALLRIRNTSPRQMTVATVGITVVRTIGVQG